MKKSADYEILYQIGRGSYASVHKAIDHQTGQVVAIKKIPVTPELSNLVNEIGILSACKCDNIVRCLGTECLDEEVSIFMEYCPAGSVKDVMRQMNFNPLGEEQISVILKDVLNGLDYLHKTHNKIHRDVKAANILLNEKGIAKLADFGVSVSSETLAKAPSIIGTPLWLPPEVIKRDAIDAENGYAIDIWSLGITIIEMADGQPPYADLDQQSAWHEIADRNKCPPTFKNPRSSALNEFLGLCLNKIGSSRKKAEELLNHELIKEAPSNEVIVELLTKIASNGFKCNELEKNLWHKTSALAKEFNILFNICTRTRMKVIKVDKMKASLKTLDQDFKCKKEQLKSRNKRIDDMIKHLKESGDENLKLERETNELRRTLENEKERKEKLLSNLGRVREEKRRMIENKKKLEALKGPNQPR